MWWYIAFLATIIIIITLNTKLVPSPPPRWLSPVLVVLGCWGTCGSKYTVYTLEDKQPPPHPKYLHPHGGFVSCRSPCWRQN